MSVTAKVTALKQQFERLFPGKWLIDQHRSRNLATGLKEIDGGITRGIARKRITEWVGPVSSGKTTILRAAVKHWCAQGLNVAYIDTEGKLYAADWSMVGNRKPLLSGKSALRGVSQNDKEFNANTSGGANAGGNADSKNNGIFWIVRPSPLPERTQSTVVPLVSKKSLCLQEAVWSADQFIRSNAFDVVVLDMGASNPERMAHGAGYMPDRRRMYTRLQRALERSRAALIVVSDTETNDSIINDQSAQAASGCHSKFVFNQSTINCIDGLNGVAMMVPSITFKAWRAGMSQEMEVRLAASVPNRLFTHSRVPDRRTSKG